MSATLSNMGLHSLQLFCFACHPMHRSPSFVAAAYMAITRNCRCPLLTGMNLQRSSFTILLLLQVAGACFLPDDHHSRQPLLHLLALY